MKKYSPYIFPLVVVVIVFFLVYRWYSIRTQRDTMQPDISDGIQIENLSPEELQSVLRGSRDVMTTELEPSDTPAAETVGRGSIKYEIVNNKVNFTVSADLPDDGTTYRVWVRTVGDAVATEAFDLEMGKGGYMGSASVSQEQLPLEVVVSAADSGSELEMVSEKAVLTGVIAAPMTTASPSASPVSM